MPTLHWIWKDKVVNHHLEVPYRILQKQYTFGDVEKSENKIIHGDNLDALKSLLPEYEGKVKCIYIDPPYNTGNEWWVYNDNLTDPKLKKWLHQVVWKEWEDLTRHDKWLCMMYPRLKLLHKLLADNGAIFVSIDDNEQANLKLIMDEIFWGNNFLADAIWQHSIQPKWYSGKFSVHHNHTFIYSKSQDFVLKNLERTDEHNVAYANPDNDPRWAWRSWDVRNALYRPNLIYDVITPTWKIIAPPEKGWRWSKETLQEKISTGEIIFSKDEKRIIRKIYLDTLEGRTPETIWFGADVWTTRDANKVLKEIFDDNVPFDTPKPVELIDRVIQLSTSPWDIILDSFAGSGTTAHAVLNLNARNPEEAKRKFILIETEDYAETITAERVKRVIKWYGNTEWRGSDFEYLTLGSPLMTEDGLLSSDASLEDIRSYICYTETGSHLLDSPLVDHPYWLARSEDRDHYFYFERESITILDREFLSTITESQPYYTIWADQCHLSASFMKKEGITFRKIPRDIRNI
jgi:adenine-specific DNA-methyltransferase